MNQPNINGLTRPFSTCCTSCHHCTLNIFLPDGSQCSNCDESRTATSRTATRKLSQCVDMDAQISRQYNKCASSSTREASTATSTRSMNVKSDTTVASTVDNYSDQKTTLPPVDTSLASSVPAGAPAMYSMSHKSVDFASVTSVYTNSLSTVVTNSKETMAREEGMQSPAVRNTPSTNSPVSSGPATTTDESMQSPAVHETYSSQPPVSPGLTSTTDESIQSLTVHDTPSTKSAISFGPATTTDESMLSGTVHNAHSTKTPISPGPATMTEKDMEVTQGMLDNAGSSSSTAPTLFIADEPSFMSGDLTSATTDSTARLTTSTLEPYQLGWDTWLPWSACTESCGGGRRFRLKICHPVSSVHNCTATLGGGLGKSIYILSVIKTHNVYMLANI